MIHPSFNPGKKCPICGKKLNQFYYDDDREFILQCPPCKYMIHKKYQYLILRCGEFHKIINLNKKEVIYKKRDGQGNRVEITNMKQKRAFMLFGAAIKKERERKIILAKYNKKRV